MKLEMIMLRSVKSKRQVLGGLIYLVVYKYVQTMKEIKIELDKRR